MVTFNIHHIIPVKVFEKFKDKLSIIFGDTFLQDYNNRLALLTDPADIAKLESIYNNNPNMADTSNIGLSQHKGPHPAYNQYISEKLDYYLNDPDFNGQPDRQRTAIIDFQKVLMDDLKSGVDFLRSDGSGTESMLEKLKLILKIKYLPPKTLKIMMSA